MFEANDHQYLAAVLEHSPVALVVIDGDGRVATWNPAAEALFGYSRPEAVGRNIDDLVAGSERHGEAVDYSRKALDGEIFHSISQRTRKDGAVVDVEVKGVPVTVDGQQFGALAIYHDITALQRARRQAEDAARVKSEFLANMSHEIRTPMNGVIGTTSLLLDTPLTARQREYVEIIRTSGDSLLTLINDILDFSKIEAGRLELEEQAFRLHECLDSAVDLIRAPAVERGIELLVNIHPDVPDVIRGDVTRLRQVIVNLLGNAVKFTEAGEIELSVTPAANEDPAQDGHRLEFSVRDTGLGIEPTQLERLFESFTQGDTSSTRRFEGTGLGLAICRQLAALMGGSIRAESAGLGEGSTFHLALPFRRGGELPEPRHNRPHGALRGRSVLVVDDNRINRLIMTRMVAAWGMAAVDCAGGRDALAAIDGGADVDVAILDVQMPDMDGITLAEELRRRRSAAELPLIIISSLGQTLQLPEHIAPAPCLHKPVKPPQLFDALLDAMGASPHEPGAASAGASEFDECMAARHPLRILLAEDNRVNQTVIRLMLEKLGYRLDLVSNGIEALEALRSRDYDVVLMDIQMPEMNGRDATRRLRAELPAGRQPYIIALTANALGRERDEYLAEGMDDYVSKPVVVSELRAALEHCMPTGVAIGREDGSGSTASTADTAPACRPTIDCGVLKAHFPYQGLDASMLEDLVDDFLQDAEDQLAALREHITRRDPEAAARVAHTLKGTARTFGAVGLSQAFEELETVARDGFLSSGDELLARIDAELPAVREKLGPAIRTLVQ